MRIIMRKLIFICLFFFSLDGFGQAISYLGAPTTTNYMRGYLLVDSLAVMPVLDTVFPTNYPSYLRKKGALVVKGTLPYFYNGTAWSVFQTGPAVDTTSLSTRINARVKYTDTSAMLSPYLRKIDTSTLSSRINLKLNISDTAAMLSPYMRTVNATSGTVTNVATGLGLSGGPITTTGTILVDTSSTSILSRQRAVNTYLQITDTTNHWVTSVIGSTPIASSGGQNPIISIADAKANASTKGASTYTANDFDATAGLISIDYTNGQAASATAKGFLTAADWNTFNNKGNGTVTNVSSADANITVANNTTTPVITLVQTPALQSATTTVNVSSATAPTSGQVLTATSSTAATWQTSSGSGTVTNVTATDNTGQTWTITNPTTTPNLSLALTSSAVGLGNVDNTSDASKPVSTATQTALNLKSNIASPTFTGTVTVPTPFTLGAVSVTTTGTQLNYLNAATGTTGTTSTKLVFSTSPALVTPDLGTPTVLVGTNITGTAEGLTAGTVTTNANLTGPITSVGNATSIASQTGTGTKFVVDNTPTLITPILGVATATSLNTGTTLNGTIFAKSATAITLASTTHPLTVGNESTGINGALGIYSTSFGIQGRNNGANVGIFLNPLGGAVAIGDASLTGQRVLLVNNTGAGTGDYAAIEIRNAAAATDALRLFCMGTAWTTSGMNKQDYGVLSTGTNISGLSIGTQASAPIEFYTNNTLRATMAAATGDISTTGGLISTGTAGIGYATGAGGTVAQGTSRTTTVVLNKLCGTITMFSAAQAADAFVTFTLTNSTIAATDILICNHNSATNGGAWTFSTVCGAGTATISIRNNSAASITSATPINFIVLKASTN